MQPYKVWMIQDLIEKNKRVFKIPVYQRNYDWKDTECTKLFEDIMNAFEQDKKHFTGSIVYIKGDRVSSKLEEVIVIDGQQRITTLFIMLKALLVKAVELNEIGIINEIQDYIFNRNCEETYKLKLKPIKEDDKQFQLLINDKFEDLQAESNIIKNYRLFIKLIDREIAKGRLLSDILEGLKKLEAIEIVLDVMQGDDPQTIFESINSTGLDLSLADLVRNYVLMSDFNQDKLYEEYWQKIESNLTTNCIADFMITFLNFKSKEIVTQNNAYIKFKELFANNGYSNESMLSELLHYSKYYALFIGRQNKYNSKINKLVRDFRMIDQSTIYIFLFNVFDDYETQVIDEDVLCKVLNFFRVYCVRRIICEIPSNSLRGLFKSLYARLFKDDKTDYYGKIFQFFFTIRTKDRFPDDMEFRQKLIKGNLYNKKKVCKYLLSCIENEKSNECLSTESLTIEHIMPQKFDGGKWREEIGSNYIDVYNTYLHTLGNLTITGYNSEMGIKTFAEKKTIIIDKSKANRLNKDVLNKERWDEDAIIDRAKNLADLVINVIFDFEKLQINEVTIDDNKILTLDDDDLITCAKPKQLNLAGEMIEVESFADVLSKTIQTLSMIDMQLLNKLANENFRIKNAGRAYLSFNKDFMRKAHELGNTGIYYETNLSAKNTFSFIEELLDRYGIDKEEFSIIIE